MKQRLIECLREKSMVDVLRSGNEGRLVRMPMRLLSRGDAFRFKGEWYTLAAENIVHLEDQAGGRVP